MLNFTLMHIFSHINEKKKKHFPRGGFSPAENPRKANDGRHCRSLDHCVRHP